MQTAEFLLFEIMVTVADGGACEGTALTSSVTLPLPPQWPLLLGTLIKFSPLSALILSTHLAKNGGSFLTKQCPVYLMESWNQFREVFM